MTLIGGGLAFSSKAFSSPELLILGRFLCGINMGVVCGMVPLYLTEISPNEFRGKAASANTMAISAADMTGMAFGLPFAFGTDNNWPFAFLWPALFSLLLIIVLPFCPESPKYLLLTLKQRKRSHHSLSVLVGHSQSYAALEELKEESRATSKLVSFREDT